MNQTVTAGRAVLGIELGSTRIKACLLGDDPSVVLATGSHEWENELVDGSWTYSLDAVWSGLQAAYADLAHQCEERFGATPTSYAAIGISAMMHGYLAFDTDDRLLVPFRTWRNTTTVAAAAELTELFGLNIPLRWSVAHLHQAVLDAEPHVAHVAHLTTLAGHVHHRLTGHRVIGVGDASGMFPIDAKTRDYDETLLSRYDASVAGTALTRPLRELLPQVRLAGQPAGRLTAEGAALLDLTGHLAPGALLSAPEGDAGTGMVATNAITPRTGNVSIGTSIFAMVVLDRVLERVHADLDLVTTPVGDPVAMVHCNNGASELAAWVGLFHRFAVISGSTTSVDAIYRHLFDEALAAEPDAGGLLAFNHLAGEPVAGLTDGRPLFVRTPGSRFTLANVVRAQIYGVFATLALGMRVLADEGVGLDRLVAHGGLFRTSGVAQRFLAAALDVPVAVVETAAEGGAWGAAVLAHFTASTSPDSPDSPDSPGSPDLAAYLAESVFADARAAVAVPDPQDVAGFGAYRDRYRAGLAVERAAISALDHHPIRKDPDDAPIDRP